MWNYIFLSIFVIFKSIYLAKSADPTTQPPCWTSLPVDKSNLNASNCFIRDCKQDEQCICDTKTGLCHQYCTANFCPLIKCNAPMGCDQHTNNHFNKIKVLEATSKIVQQKCHTTTSCEDLRCKATKECSTECSTVAKCGKMKCDSETCNLKCKKSSNCDKMSCTTGKCNIACEEASRCGSMVCEDGVKECNLAVTGKSNSPVKMICNSGNCSMECEKSSRCEFMECQKGTKNCKMLVKDANKVKSKTAQQRVEMFCHAETCVMKCESGSFCEWMECTPGVGVCNMTCADQSDCVMKCRAKNCTYDCGPGSACKIIRDAVPGGSRYTHEHIYILLISILVFPIAIILG